MTGDNNPFPLIILLTLLMAFGVGASFINVITEQSALKQGRDNGIIFCSEKPEQCKIEYTYLKLKQTQK
jgi:hypothetical protein